MIRIFTPEEAARVLKISENTVRKLLVRGEIKAFRVGTHWKIPETSLDEAVERWSQEGRVIVS